MSAMDLLMQLDLPAVSDSSDTEDFLQELAAINDSGLLRATMESLECGRLTPLIKEELRCRIQSRRLSEGKDELFVEFPSPTPSQPRPDEVEKRDRRREQNRRAAQKFRKKKKERGAHLVEETERLEGQNTTLRSEIRQLHEERDQLTRIIRSHASVCPLTPRHSPLTVVRESPLLVVPLRESPISTVGGCQGLTLIRESPLTTADALKAHYRESPLPGEINPRESPLTTGIQRQTGVDDAQLVASASVGKRKECENPMARKSPRLIRESPLLAALACLSSASASSQATGGAMQCGHQLEGYSNSSKSPVLGMTSGVSPFTLQSSAVVSGGESEAGDSAPSGRVSRNGRRSSLLMQSPVMGGARPSVVMQSPALLVPPTRESPVPLLIINPGGGATGGAGIGAGIGQVTRTGSATMTSPLPPSGRAVPSSPVPMTSRPRKSPIALFRGNPSPVHLHQQQLINPVEQRLAMDQSPILFGSPPKQSKHSIPPRLNLSGPKPVKPILPKPPSSSLSSASSTASSSSSFPCSSPRTPQSFMASPLPTTASPVSATGRPVHASPVFFGEGCFTPSVGRRLSSSGYINTGEFGIQQSSKSPLFQADDANTTSRSPMYDSDKIRQSPMSKPDSLHQTNRSPLCILEAMRQISQSPMRKPDVKRKLNQSPLCTKESAKQHVSQSPTQHMETNIQSRKSPATCQTNTLSRADHSPMTVGDNNNKSAPISTSRITQQSPVFFGSGKGSNPPPSTNNGQFLQPQPLPRSVSAYAKTPNSSLLNLLQRGSSLPSGSSRTTASSPNTDILDSTGTSNAFAGVKASNLFHSNRGSGVFSTTPSNTLSVNNINDQSTQGVVPSNSAESNSTENQIKSNLDSGMACSSTNLQLPDSQNSSKGHEIIDVDELDEAYYRGRNNMSLSSTSNSTFNTFGLVSNVSDNNSNNNSSCISNVIATKVQETATNTMGTFFGGSNEFAPNFESYNKHPPNATTSDNTSDDVIMKTTDDSNSSAVSNQASSFNAGRIFPDSPALPSPSIMLDDNALSLEEIERSAAVLEGRDDFMDLLDIQALLELSADHNSNNNSGNGNGNNFSNCDNNIGAKNQSGLEDSSHSEGQRNITTACTVNAQIANTPEPGFSGTQRKVSIANKTGVTNPNNNTLVQQSVPTVFNSQPITQDNVANTDTNFLFNIPPNSLQTDQDRYAQILASFRGPQIPSQNCTFPVMCHNSQSSLGTQHLANVEQTSDSGIVLQAAQTALPVMASGNIFVSSATSTIHHHPSQQQSFLTPAQCPDTNYVGNVSSTIAPPALSNTQNFLIAPQTIAPQLSQTDPALCNNQTRSFMIANQSAMPLFQIGNQQQHLHQSGLNQERYSLNAQWRPPLPHSTDALTTGLNRISEQRLRMVHPQSNDGSGSFSNLNAQAPSGFSTYRSSRLRELLNAPTTPEVTCSNTDISSASLRAAVATNASTMPFSSAGVAGHSGWESQANTVSTSGGFNFIHRAESAAASTPERHTGQEQNFIWDPMSSAGGGLGQTEGTEWSKENNDLGGSKNFTG